VAERAAIIGAGAVKVGQYADSTESAMALDAIAAALKDAGIAKDRIGGIFTTPDLRMSIGLQLNLICDYMRIRPKVAAEVTCGAIAPGLAIRFACNEIMLGNLDVAVCYGAAREASTGWFKNFGAGEGSAMFEPTTAQPYGTKGVAWAYALSAKDYMHDTGATEEHFAMAVVRNRDNAAHSEFAAITKPVTVGDVMRAPPLCAPIKLLDAPVTMDGAAALVIASERVARDVCEKPVFVAGIGQYHDDSLIIPTDGCDKPISTFVSTKEATKEALDRAGISLDDIDVAEVYAPFSPHELMIPEDIGWFERGEMTAAIERGDTHVGGKIPINTDGGVLSRGHPWAVTPFYEAVTVVQQLRGEMGPNQVQGARNGLVHCEAGMLNSTLITILTRD